MRADLAIAPLFARQHGLVARSQAVARGLSPYAIRYRIRSGEWSRVHPGVYRLASSPETFHQRLLAACLSAGADAVASHRAAASLLGLPVPDGHVEITVPECRRIRIAGARLHRTTDLATLRRRRIDGIPVTTPSRTVVDLAKVLDPDQLEAVLDHTLAERIVSVRSLTTTLASRPSRGRRGTALLARLLAQRPAGRAPESRFESRLLRALTAFGLPHPTTQYSVRLPNGRTARLDFAYPEALLAVEADSYRHHSSMTAWSRDRVRHNELMTLGWRVLPVTFRDLLSDPAAVADQVARCLQGATFGA
jgi:very-short-patch-repair endonuclease